MCVPSSSGGNREAEHPTPAEHTDQIYSPNSGSELADLSEKSVLCNEKGERLHRCRTAIPDGPPGARCGHAACPEADRHQPSSGFTDTRLTAVQGTASTMVDEEARDTQLKQGKCSTEIINSTATISTGSSRKHQKQKLHRTLCPESLTHLFS